MIFSINSTKTSFLLEETDTPPDENRLFYGKKTEIADDIFEIKAGICRELGITKYRNKENQPCDLIYNFI